MSQFFYVHPDNPQPRLIRQSVDILRKGGVIVWPTDSGYALACRLEEKAAMARICHIRKLDVLHNFTLICHDLSEIATYAYLDNQAFRLIKNSAPGNYTFILKATKEVPRRLMNEKRKTIGIRVLSNAVSLALLAMLKEPLMSTTLIRPGSDVVESNPEEIKTYLNKQVDLIIHGGYLEQHLTTVIDLTGVTPEIVRAGAGNLAPFS